jgi:hypothetical protein
VRQKCLRSAAWLPAPEPDRSCESTPLIAAMKSTCEDADPLLPVQEWWSINNMRSFATFGFGVTTALLLVGCRGPHNRVGASGAGLGIHSGTLQPNSFAPAETAGTWSPDAWLGESRHPNRATREPQYIPD